MMSQNRQAAQDRLEANIDHEVNVKAEVGVGVILKRLDDLQSQVMELQNGQRVPSSEKLKALAA